MDVEEVGPDRDASPVGKGRARFALPLPPRLAEAVLTLGLGVAALAALPLRGAEATGRDLLIFGTLFAIGLLLARVSLREQVARWRFALARGAGLAAALALAGDLLSGAVLGCALTLAHSGGLRTSRSLPAIGAGLAVAAGTVALLAPHLALPIALVFVATLLPRLAAAPAARYPTKKPESAPEGLFLVNALGASPGEPERFSQHLARAEIGGCSLLDATLVADRPALLRSLSVALREGQAQTLELRLARPDAPGYIARRLTIEPLAPATGLAAIRLDRPVPAATAASGTRLEAALHDLVAPFNAGFGYLELLADPLLASTDPATRP